MDSSISDDDLTTAYLLGAEHMRDKLHKQTEDIERLLAENEKLREAMRDKIHKQAEEIERLLSENEKLLVQLNEQIAYRWSVI